MRAGFLFLWSTTMFAPCATHVAGQQTADCATSAAENETHDVEATARLIERFLAAPPEDE